MFVFTGRWPCPSLRVACMLSVCSYRNDTLQSQTVWSRASQTSASPGQHWLQEAAGWCRIGLRRGDLNSGSRYTA